jgi:medium-chain acyl-[acyl-carrier-protein] hydrolase
LTPLVEALAKALQPHLDRPFAFLGHSLGALVAFELARRLGRVGGPQPTRLFASGCAAPHLLKPGRMLHQLADAEFRAELRRFNGTPPAILAHDELMSLLLPTLRADFALVETYRFATGPRLNCPLEAWGGRNDQTVGPDELHAWREQTTGPARLRIVPGDHFFIQTAQPMLFRVLEQDLLGQVTHKEGWQ